MTTISATIAKATLYNLLDEVSRKRKRISITEKGKTKAVLMSAEELESLEETMEILADKKLMRDIRQGEKDIAEGRYSDWEDVKKELGWDKKDVATQNHRASKKKS